jgi:hypothetical protein
MRLRQQPLFAAHLLLRLSHSHRPHHRLRRTSSLVALHRRAQHSGPPRARSAPASALGRCCCFGQNGDGRCCCFGQNGDGGRLLGPRGGSRGCRLAWERHTGCSSDGGGGRPSDGSRGCRLAWERHTGCSSDGGGGRPSDGSRGGGGGGGGSTCSTRPLVCTGLALRCWLKMGVLWSTCDSTRFGAQRRETCSKTPPSLIC